MGKQFELDFNKEYVHFISLGYCCAIAEELERNGLREASLPFDWQITDFQGVITAIDNSFDRYLDYEELLQNVTYPQYYMDKRYNCQFYHDFDKYRSLKQQIGFVKEKYDRRIKRLYRFISEPTLFIRYISDEGKNGVRQEIEYIEKNAGMIRDTLKKFNSENDIIFIANRSITSESIKIYHVDKDDNDSINRRPFDSNEDIKRFIVNLRYPPPENNRKYAYFQEKGKEEKQ